MHIITEGIDRFLQQTVETGSPARNPARKFIHFYSVGYICEILARVSVIYWLSPANCNYHTASVNLKVKWSAPFALKLILNLARLVCRFVCWRVRSTQSDSFPAGQWESRRLLLGVVLISFNCWLAFFGGPRLKFNNCATFRGIHDYRGHVARVLIFAKVNVNFLVQLNIHLNSRAAVRRERWRLDPSHC